MEEKQKSKFGIGTWLIIIFGIIFALYLIGLFIPDEKAPLDFKVLKDYQSGSGKTLVVLVSAKSDISKVTQLTRYLKKKNDSYNFLYIDIFDSEEAYLHREDESYPEKEYSKHWLASVARNNSTGYNKMFILDKKTGKFKDLE